MRLLHPLQDPVMAAAREGSMRGRWVVFLVAATALAWLATAAAVLRAAREEAGQRDNQRLEESAALMLQVVGRDPIAATLDSNTGTPAAAPAARYRYQVWSANGSRLHASADADARPFVPLTESGHREILIDGAPHRVFAAWNGDRTVQVQLAIPEPGLALAFDRVSAALLGLLMASTAVLIGLLLWRYVRTERGVASATALLAGQQPDADPPLPLTHVAPELRPLIAQVDALRRRFAGVLEAERRFAASAAHELRTPLAAVRVQAQVAERARTPEDAREALSQLQVCVERASRTIDQLLTLAQLEAAQVHPSTATTVDLASLAARVVHDMNPLLRARGIELTMNLQPVAVQGLEHGLAALLRNLLDNAARHSPPSSRVNIASGSAFDHAFVAVDDSGPGIPPEERDRVFERFYRLPTTDGDGDGVGVGLSIVQSVARVHGGRIELTDSDLGGLRAALFLRKHHGGSPPADRAVATAGRIDAATRDE